MRNDTGTVSLRQDLKGTVVLDAETACKRGYATDVVINPAQGTVLALIFQSPNGQERALAGEDFLIHDKAKAVIAFSDPFADDATLTRALKEGASADLELVGADVVTEDGKMLGRITDVFIQKEPMHVVYRVTTSLWQELFGGGVYLIGNTIRAYSRLGGRLIVPANTKKRLAYRSLADSISAWKRELTAAQ
jgi:uncharacterized protein YrrD